MKTIVALLLVLLLPACAGDSGEPALSGRVTAHDGTPLRGADVSLSGPGDRVRTVTDADGRFSIEVDRPGGHWLWLTGVHHKTVLLPLLIDGPLEVDVQLAAASYASDFRDVRVIGDFNDFSLEEGVVAMQRQPDGTFTAEITTAGDSLFYQLIGVQADDFPIAGTGAARYVFDGDRPLVNGRSGKYISVTGTTGGRARVVFDPQLLPRSVTDERVQFGDPSSTAARLVDMSRDIEARVQRSIRAYREYVDAGGDPGVLDYDWSEDRAALIRQFDAEKIEVLRQYLLLNLTRFGFSAKDSDLADRIVEAVPPDSPVWSLEWAGPLNTFATIATASMSPDSMRAYATRVVDSHADPLVQSSFLFYLLERARNEGDAELWNRYYLQLQDDFGDTDYARLAKSLFAIERNVVVGKPLPRFEIPSLHDPVITYTDRALIGHVYLIHFWATWCGPCVAELEDLHAAHERYVGRGFRIFSVSLDKRRSDVLSFTGAEWPMPWQHAFVDRHSIAEVTTAFEIASIPKPILIDRSGIIVATGSSLRGPELEETLGELLDSETGPR
jgi:thiol-disulfide isomerase/thioredoxin